MFNTLIAILGDTYSKIMEKRVFYGLKAKTEIYADFMYFIKFVRGIDKFTESRFMYLVQPNDDDGDD